MNRKRVEKSMFWLILALLILGVLGGLAVAMVPGPVEEDDVPPPPKAEPIFAPKVSADDLPLMSLADYATFPPQAYAHAQSIGLPNRGALRGGVLFPRDTALYVANRANRQWSTPETADALLLAATRVHQRFGPSHKLVLGDLSYAKGGRLRTHASHQSGRDADVGFYFKHVRPWHFVSGSPQNIDVKRTWTFIETLLDVQSVEYIFLDYSLQPMFYEYAKNRLAYPPEKLTRIFQYPRGRGARYGIIRHARGHKNHLHIRFYSPIAVANARNMHYADANLAELQRKMIKVGLGQNNTVRPRVYSLDDNMQARLAYFGGDDARRVTHTVRRGDTLWSIARRYNVTVSQLRTWNKLSLTDQPRIGQELTLFRNAAQ